MEGIPRMMRARVTYQAPNGQELGIETHIVSDFCGQKWWYHWMEEEEFMENGRINTRERLVYVPYDRILKVVQLP